MDIGGLNPAWLIIATFALAILPFFLMMTTSYVKILVVISLVKNALGVQQIPPQMVINGLAMILTVFIMAPVANDTLDLLEKETNKTTVQITPSNVFVIADHISPPLKKFLKANTDERVSNMLVATAQQVWPEKMRHEISKDNWSVVIPAFTLTELSKAFQIGFVLYLAFIAIDLIISNILLAMGMMMVSPTTISLPFKLLLFVTLDGWLKISQGLILSYT